jgi:hypothetical protein
MTDESQTYLGDGLYAADEGYQLALTADPSSNSARTIYLDHEVYAALQRYAAERGYGPAAPAVLDAHRVAAATDAVTRGATDIERLDTLEILAAFLRAYEKATP